MSSLDRVTCEDAFRKIDDFLDRELTEEELARIDGHLEICAACASEFEFERSVLDGVRAKLRRVAAPPDLLARISLLIAADRDDGSRG
jgi:anti-sigma factor (TIGR02949 family)